MTRAERCYQAICDISSAMSEDIPKPARHILQNALLILIELYGDMRLEEKNKG